VRISESLRSCTIKARGKDRFETAINAALFFDYSYFYILPPFQDKYLKIEAEY
jgi:putative cell wall-binding protein